MSEPLFHPAVAAWFEKRLGSPTEPQAAAWPLIKAGRHTLIAAPTGSGKTLAAFLSAIDDLVRRGLEAPLPDATLVVYVSPLKALSNDIRKNLEEPLAGIRAELGERGLPDAGIRTLVRTGDTTPSERAAMMKRPPHLLVTTPESLYILLTSDGGRRMLRTARTLIVDEIHAVADDKRGSHLALSMERLASLVAGEAGAPRLTRIGLSATQTPIEEVARFLVGAGQTSPAGVPDCAIIDVGHRRAMDLGIEIPDSPLETVMSHEVWGEIYDRLAGLIGRHRTTLVFVNTRKLAERITRHLSERLGTEYVAAHHGSLSKERRLSAEQRLKSGDLRALVATASLELGIDIGAVELVCQIGSPRSIATFLQRVGRSGHSLTGMPKGRLFPQSRDDLVECAALLDAVRRGELDRLAIPEKPLDILAQQIVAAVSADDWRLDDLFEMARRAWPYRRLERREFDEILAMLSEGFTTRRGRRGALIHLDAVGGRVRGRRGARLTAVTCGGAIPDNADYQVLLEPNDTFLGTVNEDFAVESSAGDIFQLGNSSWRILKIEQQRVRVADAGGALPNIPFWLGEAPGRTPELSRAVSRLRGEIDRRLDEPAAAREWLTSEVGLSPEAAAPLVEYLETGRAALGGALPTQARLVLERFFDEAGNSHLVLHAPFGSRINRAWGLALRKRFCRQFNFELQAAATEDAILLSLGPTHSFPLEDVFHYLNSRTVRDILVQALLDAPMFGIRWRWNAGRALAVPRFRGGKRVPPRLQRMEAEDLVAVVFPDQLACLENISGDREVPDHPLVNQTIADCLGEAMDIDRLEALLAAIEMGEIELIARDLAEPSPLAQHAVNANPYAFLDDTPLEERRTHAIQSRRWIDADMAAALGSLDAAAIERVRREAWPDARNADELHDALVIHGFLTAAEGEAGPGWVAYFEELRAARRATRLDADVPIWVAAERLPEALALWPMARLSPVVAAPESPGRRPRSADEATIELVRGRLEMLGPVTAGEVAAPFSGSAADAAAGPIPAEASPIAAALAHLEAEGFVLRGRFTPGAAGEEWCERRLLARIHRYTIDRLRREIEPVSPAEYMRFLLAWQHVAGEGQPDGPDSLLHLLEQLEGFDAPAASWERDILPARMRDYDPRWLDALCLSGRFVWNRQRPGPPAAALRSGPVRSTPIAFLPRERLALWCPEPAGAPPVAEWPLTTPAREVLDFLTGSGASFFGEIVTGTGLLRTQVEEAIGELVSWGLVASDGVSGLRALLVPSNRRPRFLAGRGPRGRALGGIESAGRWAVVRLPALPGAPGEDRVECLARTLLRRYGIVFRLMLERESRMPAWRELIQVLRRLEARGEVRGGRFVTSFSGEQFALPEAIPLLRQLRRGGPTGEMVTVSAPDPLNLTGILFPGDRVPAVRGNRVLYRDGEPLAACEAREVRFLAEVEPGARWRVQDALLMRRDRKTRRSDRFLHARHQD